MGRNNNRKRIFEIIDAFLKGRETPEEYIFIEEFYEYAIDENSGLDNISQEEWVKITGRIQNGVNIKVSKHYKRDDMKKLLLKFFWPVASAVVLVIVGYVGIGLILKKPNQALSNIKQEGDIHQNSKYVTLSLGYGNRITMDNTGNKKIPKLTGVKCFLPKADQLVYTGDPAIDSVKYNTIYTADGNKLQLTLPDGTKVWLNSGSVLKFPSVFSMEERVVELSGEAYFEVARNSSKQFKVITDKQEIVALGSHFNVNGYITESETKTSAIKGIIKIKQIFTDEYIIVSEGQQAILKDFTDSFQIATNTL